jgi:hypothetical protein
MGLTIIVGVCLAGVVLLLLAGEKHVTTARRPDPDVLAEADPPRPAMPVSERSDTRQNIANAPVAVPSAHAAGSAAPPDCNLRITAMTRFGANDVVIGVEDRLTRQTQMLRVGDAAGNGWTLVAVDFVGESAVFQQADIRHTAYLEKGVARQPETASPGSPPNPEGAREALSSEASAGQCAPDAFSNQVLVVDGSVEVVVSGVKHAPKFVEVKTAGSTFALRREIAENILKMDSIAPEQKLQMLLTYPGAATVDDGQDPARQAADAEASLAQTLTHPPEDRPSLDDLERLVKDNPEIPPPPMPVKEP